jgi:biopolymer transport protein ExbD
MPKAKVKRKSTAIDMTPMVDLAFLLITFFMLTIQFRPPELVSVNYASAIQEATESVPTEDIIQITADEKGRVFFGVRSQKTRKEMVRLIESETSVQLSDTLEKQFELAGDLAVGIYNLPKYLSMEPAKRREMVSKGQFPGVPVDTANNNEKNMLFKYVKYARQGHYAWTSRQGKEGKSIRIMVKADQKTPYPTIQKIIHTLKSQGINRINVITAQESTPEEFRGYTAPGEAARGQSGGGSGAGGGDGSSG